jgi:hypothetical protein
MKKTWQTPQLIVLVRGQMQERILSACKSNELPDGPIANYSQCEGGDGICPSCIQHIAT